MSFYTSQSVTITAETRKLYCSTLKSIFDNINYYISKKNNYYKEIYENSKNYMDKIDNLSGKYALKADEYFILIYKSLLVENYKLAKNVLPDIKILIKNNFLIGDTQLNKLKIDIEKINEKEIFKNGKIIDLIIESFSSIDLRFEDDDIWRFAMDCLDEILKNKNIVYNVKGITFRKIYEFYLRIFPKFENDKDKIKDLKEKISFLINDTLEELNLYLNYSSPLISYNYSNKKYLMDIYKKLGTVECIDNYKNDNYHPLDLLVCREVKLIVDTICIREARGELINIKNINNGKSLIPIIPKDPSEINLIKNLYLPKISNEYSYPSGFFGWCIICRKTANYYSIKYRLPICFFHCRDILYKEDFQFQKLRSNLVKDYPDMFKYFFQILSDKTSLKSLKIYILETFMLSINNYANKYNFIFQQKNFIKVIKENLSEGLFKTCISNDPKVFVPSISLFFEVWKYFRKNLKREINFFNANIFLKILRSQNASFLHKKTILENFSKCDFLYFIELYANYDCELNEKFLVNSIISAFSDIVKGKYLKRNQSFTEEENYELINLALKTLTSMLNSIYKICEKEQNLNKKPLETDYNSIKNSVVVNNEIDFNNIDLGIKLSKINNNIIFHNKRKSCYGSDQANNNNVIQDFITETNEKIDHNLKKKYELQTAAEKFNYKIKSGISYLKKVGYLNIGAPIDTQAKNMVKFLRYTSSLKKKNIGEFLGENTELSRKTLKYFGESFDFKNIHIIQGMRIFLSTFQLPSEGQQIDRVLESFSSKFFQDNKNSFFPNADCVFYLAYAIMILQTELHNPNVKNKMTSDKFIKIFEGKEYQNLTKEYLEDIYEQIQEEPLSLAELDEEREKNLSGRTEEKYQREKQRIVKEYDFNKKLIKKNSPYMILTEDEFLEYLPQFISSIWEPLITMYSIVIEESDDPLLYNQGISGMSNCIKILGLLNLNTQKQTVISFLCNMTNLLRMKPLKKKNILCIKEILSLTNKDYRYVNGSWNFILDVVNKLYYYLLLNSLPKDEREEILNKKITNEKKNNDDKIAIVPWSEIVAINREKMQNIVKEIKQNDLEKIFSKSLNFDPETFNEFIISMFEIAKREFQLNSLTRIFFLQKIVEVVEIYLFSLSRNNINDIWGLLTDFFIDIGISTNIENATTSIDSLRQLTMKYLEKKEEYKYNLQIECFKPFLTIAKKCNDSVIKEYIIYCVINIIKNNESKIKSGWSIILNIFTEVFKTQEDNNLQLQILEILENLSKNHYEKISNIFELYINCMKLYIDKFPEKVNKIFESLILKVENEKNFKILLSCFMSLLLNNNEYIRKQSLDNVTSCFDTRLKLINSKIYDLGKNLLFWKYFIQELVSNTISEISKKIASLNSLINNINIINNNNNSTFNTLTADTTNNTNNNITNIDNFYDTNNNQINQISTKLPTNEKNEFCITFQNFLFKIVNIFNYFFSYNYKELTTFLESIEKIIFSEDEEVQKAGLECLKFLINCERMKNQYFLQTFSLFLITLANKSLEENLNSIDEKELLNTTKKRINNKILDKNLSLAFIHLNILNMLDKLLSQNIYFLNDEILNKLLDCLESSINISNNFNENIKLRFLITDYNQQLVNSFSTKENSLISEDEIFNLFKQFQFAYKNFYFIAEFLYYKDNGISNKQKYYKKILDISIKAINIYNNKSKEFLNFISKTNNEKEVKEKEAELNNYVISLNDYIFPAIQKIEFYKNENYRNIICKLFFELILCYDQRIREKVKDILNIVFDDIYSNSE